MEKIRLDEIADVTSGQIMTRVKSESPDDKIVETKKVIIPKAINDYGLIDTESLPDENLKTEIDEKKLTKKGDIVIKLNSPYDSATINEKSEGCVVPSFCAIIRIKDDKKINPLYLQAFLNSKLCKEQLETKVQGAVMTILTVGKIKEIIVPLPEETKQFSIGMTYLETQEKLSTLERIIELEKQKNDALFYEIEC